MNHLLGYHHSESTLGNTCPTSPNPSVLDHSLENRRQLHNRKEAQPLVASEKHDTATGGSIQETVGLGSTAMVAVETRVRAVLSPVPRAFPRVVRETKGTAKNTREREKRNRSAERRVQAKGNYGSKTNEDCATARRSGLPL